MFEETKTINLRKAVTLGDVTYDKLELREPEAGEIAKASVAPTNTDVAINLIAAVAKVPRRVVEKLCQRDLQEANDFFASFSSDGSLADGRS